MIELYADKAALTVKRLERLTSGAVNAFRVHFALGSAWDGLTTTAVFRAGDRSVSVLLDETGVCAVPWEVLTIPNRRLMAGVYGTRGGEVVLPTVWADCGMIQEGAAPGEGTRPPTLGAYEQLLSQLAGKQDRLTGLPGQVVGFDENGETVALDPAKSTAATEAEVAEMLDEVFSPLQGHGT